MFPSRMRFQVKEVLACFPAKYPSLPDIRQHLEDYALLHAQLFIDSALLCHCNEGVNVFRRRSRWHVAAGSQDEAPFWLPEEDELGGCSPHRRARPPGQDPAGSMFPYSTWRCPAVCL